MKFNTRYGCRFSCGWLPPTFVISLGIRVDVAWVWKTATLDAAKMFPVGTFKLPGEFEAPTRWLCAGISLEFNV